MSRPGPAAFVAGPGPSVQELHPDLLHAQLIQAQNLRDIPVDAAVTLAHGTQHGLGMFPVDGWKGTHGLNQIRGMATSIGVLVVNLLGLGLGPTAIALMTDYVRHDEHQLRYALAWLLPVMLLISAIIGFTGLASYRRTRCSLTTDQFINPER
jgi:hypothetical protein